MQGLKFLKNTDFCRFLKAVNKKFLFFNKKTTIFGLKRAWFYHFLGSQKTLLL